MMTTQIGSLGSNTPLLQHINRRWHKVSKLAETEHIPEWLTSVQRIWLFVETMRGVSIMQPESSMQWETKDREVPEGAQRSE